MINQLLTDPPLPLTTTSVSATNHKHDTLPKTQGSPHERFFKVSEDLRRFKWRFLPARTFFQRARELDPVRPPTKQVRRGGL